MNLEIIAIFLLTILTNSKLIYSKDFQKTSQDIKKCRTARKETILSILSTPPNDVSNYNEISLIEKLSSFIEISKDNIHVEEISNLSETEPITLKIKILIGCDNKYFANRKWNHKLMRNVIENGSIKTATGLNIKIWSIHKQMPKINRNSIKYKRETNDDPEDEDDEDEDDEDYEYNNDPVLPSSTETTTVTTHSHRHRHGVANKNDDDLENENLDIQSLTTKIDESSSNTPTSTSTTTTTTTTPIPSTTPTTPVATTTTTTTTELEEINHKPELKNRLQKQRVTAGKFFKITIPEETFYDKEDGTNLKLVLLDNNGLPINISSWIQFDAQSRIIYGLPLEDAVSRWHYNLIAIDSALQNVSESIDISVQQHKGHRSANNELLIDVMLADKFQHDIDWQIELVKTISETVNDSALSNIVVREVYYDSTIPNKAYLKFTNESLSKENCPQDQLNDLVDFIFRNLADRVDQKIQVTSVEGKLIGSCMTIIEEPRTKITPKITQNYPPVPRNQVDRVNATVGQLLVYKVPHDTFYDPEDSTNLKLSLLTGDRKNISERNWLKFDRKNQEFYGIPKAGDEGIDEYILVAEDREGLTATDALVVETSTPTRRDYAVYFKMVLGIKYENFNTNAQRKYVERIASIFGDSSTNLIQIRSINSTYDYDGTTVTYYNTTLYKTQHFCPEERIDSVRRTLLHQDNIIKDNIKKMFQDDFVLKTILILDSCSIDSPIHRERIPIGKADIGGINRNNVPTSTTSLSDDYLYTFIIPAIIIISMIIIAAIVACVLHRRKLTGKMEIGNEEERKSFRSKGIPVIFQDELEEKPEIGNKSPIILKYEKPPLLPHGDNDVEKYVAPSSGYIGGREQRGKSPVTPSYRKPPPYVSP